MKQHKRGQIVYIGIAIIILLGISYFLMSNGGMNRMTKLILRIEAPGTAYQMEEHPESMLGWLKDKILKNIPLYTYSKGKEKEVEVAESVISYNFNLEEVMAENERVQEIEERTEEKQEDDFRKAVLKKYSRKKLKKYSYLVSNFYHVDSTTVLPRRLLKFQKLFYMDLSISKEGDEPRILIYHTHAHEDYKKSKKSKGKTVVDLGDVLTEILEEEYGIPVLHHKGVYDKDRDVAYSKALPSIEKILKDNPSIEVVIDLHRDGVGEKTRLVTEVDGKKVAKIMFFNGVSRTRRNGELAYLKNENLMTNLAFSLQMQLAASTYYENLTRGTYIKGYRYNLHVKDKTLLVEVGAQTNTFEEAKNAMPPLADLLNKVLGKQ